MTVRLIKLAAIYLVLGMTLGIGMGLAEDHTLRGVHAHMNLLGWATLGLAALVFHIFPHLAQTRLATAWFWLYNLALAVALVAVRICVYGDLRCEMVRNIGFAAVWLGGVLFAANILINLRERAVSGVAVRA